jgi:SAM-dependent methyltransferase
MGAHSPLAHLIPRSVHSASTRGHTLGAPRVYDAVVGLFFVGRRRPSFEALIDTAGVKPVQHVLDVGCGTGYFARLLAQAVGNDGLVVGVDASPEMIRYASDRARRARNCQFQLGTAESLSFPAEHFDVVQAVHGRHRAQVAAFIQQIRVDAGWRLIYKALVMQDAQDFGTFGTAERPRLRCPLSRMRPSSTWMRWCARVPDACSWRR